MSAVDRSFNNDSRSLLKLVQQSKNYLNERNIVYDGAFVDPDPDVPDRQTPSVPAFPVNKQPGMPVPAVVQPSPIQSIAASRGAEYERMYYQETTKSKSLEEELRGIRALADRIRSEKDALKSGYEEFIARLRAENEGLKKSELKLVELTESKRRLELELQRISTELNAARSDSSREAVIEELRIVITQLKAEKNQLRSQLESHKNQIAELVTNITTIRAPNDDEANALRGQLTALQSKYDQLYQDYTRQRNQPIQVPDNAELRRLLEEKMNTIDALQNKIRFLDDELLRARNKQCEVCPVKDVALANLTNKVRELESRPPIVQRIETVQAAPVQRIEVVQPRVEVVRAPSITTVERTYVSPSVVTTQAAHCNCSCSRMVRYSVSNRCPYCGSDSVGARRVVGSTEYSTSPSIVRRVSPLPRLSSSITLTTPATTTYTSTPLTRTYTSTPLTTTTYETVPVVSTIAPVSTTTTYSSPAVTSTYSSVPYRTSYTTSTPATTYGLPSSTRVVSSNTRVSVPTTPVDIGRTVRYSQTSVPAVVKRETTVSRGYAPESIVTLKGESILTDTPFVSRTQPEITVKSTRTSVSTTLEPSRSPIQAASMTFN